MNLYDRLPIDIWKIIADCVQRLNIYNFTDDEFRENLIMLKEMLDEYNFSFDLLSRYPNCLGEIGLASLLQGIYGARVYDDYKKANFYEKIYQLSDLGIPSVEFMPIGFPSEIKGVSLLKDECNGEIIGIRNCFTDGNFDIGYPDEPLDRWYDIVNLENANYVFNVLVNKGLNGNYVNQDESYAILRNFNGVFPSKETVYDIRYPGLCMYDSDIYDDRRHYILKQFFYPFDNNTGRYSKKLVRMKDNYHYE